MGNQQIAQPGMLIEIKGSLIGPEVAKATVYLRLIEVFSGIGIIQDEINQHLDDFPIETLANLMRAAGEVQEAIDQVWRSLMGVARGTNPGKPGDGE